MKNQWRGTCMNNRHCKKIRWVRWTPRSLISLPVRYFQWSQRQLRFIRADEKILMQQNAMTGPGMLAHIFIAKFAIIFRILWPSVECHVAISPCVPRQTIFLKWRCNGDMEHTIIMLSAASARTKSQVGTAACTPAGWDSSRSLIFFVWEITEYPHGEWTCNEPQNGFRAIKITTARKHRVATAWWKF